MQLLNALLEWHKCQLIAMLISSGNNIAKLLGANDTFIVQDELL